MYEPRDQLIPFHYRDKRWACLVMHRRFGKTVGCINELLTRALATNKKDARYAYIAPFYSQAKAIAWDYLKRYGFDVIVKISESELQVELPNGARIRLYGADNPNALRGLYLDGVVLDEYADMRPSVWGAILRPMLADRKGWAVFIGTPKGHNAFYDIYTLSKEDDGWFSLVVRASESGVLPQEELADARKSMSADQYEQEFECSFEAAILGAVYGQWMAEAEKSGRIIKDLYDPGLPVHTAWDLGFDDSTAVWFWQVVRGEIRLIDYFEDSIADIEHYCERLYGRKIIIDSRNNRSGAVEKWHLGDSIDCASHRAKYRYGKHWVPHDAANKLQAAGGRSIVQQAFAVGVKMYVVPSTSQQNSESAARSVIEIAWFDPVATKQGMECLKQYQYEYDEEKKTFKSKPRHDWASHGADAFEIIGQVWRTPKDLEDEPAPRFLHELTADEVFFPKHTHSNSIERI